MKLELTKAKVRYWVDVVLDGMSVTTKWGQTGVPAKSQKRKYKSAANARAAYDRVVAEKLAEGYRDPDAIGVDADESPRDPALEAAIRANRKDRGAYEVYADWLQTRGAVHGELIALELHGKRARAKKLIDELGLPGDNLVTFEWLWGMWYSLRIENGVDWMDDSFDAVALARRLFARSMCAALSELRLGVLRWEHNHVDVPAVIDEAARHAWAADLVRLRLGDVGSEVDMAHHVIGDVGRRIGAAFPNLLSLSLHSGSQDWHGQESFGFDGLDLPKLVELVIETCSMSRERLAHLLAARLPSLRRLHVWFGSARYGADITASDLQPLVDGSRFAGVTKLGLCNAELANDLVPLVCGSAVAARLDTLELSMGTMTDDAALELVRNADRFPALETLSLDENFLTPRTTRAVRAAFPFASVARQKDPDRSIAGETHYYVSVAE